MWQHRISHENVSTGPHLQLFWVILAGYRQFFILSNPYLTPRMPQKESKFVICPKWVTVSNLWWEITSLCKFAASGVLLLEKWTIFDLFWSLGCSKKGQNLWFLLNEWQYKICDQKLYLCANIQLLGIILLEMANFDPLFWPPFDPRRLEKWRSHGKKDIGWKR